MTEEQIQAWAEEAEEGFPVDQLRRRGRRPVGDGPGEMIAVRMDESLLAGLSARAERDHISRSEAIRAAVKAWIVADSEGSNSGIGLVDSRDEVVAVE